jgi:serine/threonine protein phosphatase PrpC
MPSQPNTMKSSLFSSILNYEISGSELTTPGLPPNFSNFKIDENRDDFIVLGCDGIFERMNSINTIDSAWSS